MLDACHSEPVEVVVGEVGEMLVVVELVVVVAREVVQRVVVAACHYR